MARVDGRTDERSERNDDDGAVDAGERDGQRGRYDRERMVGRLGFGKGRQWDALYSRACGRRRVFLLALDRDAFRFRIVRGWTIVVMVRGARYGPAWMFVCS